MRNYRVECRIGDRLITRTIECREMTIEDSSYCFWTGDYGATNRLAWAFPIMFTIIEGLPDTEEI
jgi:hypothetical protein